MTLRTVQLNFVSTFPNTWLWHLRKQATDHHVAWPPGDGVIAANAPGLPNRRLRSSQHRRQKQALYPVLQDTEAPQPTPESPTSLNGACSVSLGSDLQAAPYSSALLKTAPAQ